MKTTKTHRFFERHGQSIMKRYAFFHLNIKYETKDKDTKCARCEFQ